MALEPIALRTEMRLSSPPAELWPLVSNTNRFNQALGLPAVSLEAPIPGEFAKRVSASLYGLKLSWSEPPFEWSEGRFFRVARTFDRGPIARFEGGVTLTPDGKGTLLKADAVFTPRNALGTFVIKHALAKRVLADSAAMFRRFDASLGGAGEPFPVRRTRTAPDAAALAQRAETLHEAPVNRALASRLLHFIDHAYDDELAQIRPFALADRWGADRLDTLRLFLYATKAGLLDMSWEVLCPNCAGANIRPNTIAALDKTAHCGSCQIDYGVNLDESVEVRFTVSANVRPVAAHTFCVGNPARTPFAVAQLVVRPGAARELEADLGAESYVLRELEARASVQLHPDADGPSTLDVDLGALAPGARLSFKPGLVTLRVKPGREVGLVRVERESWKEKGARASLVTTLQEFRDLFSSEVLAPGVEIAVRSVAVMFTDLKDSTTLYESVGDALAYAIVRDHFAYLTDIVRKRNGAVVKTIGDAVMAVFSRTSDAVEAALEMQERVGELNARLAPRPGVAIKLGVHAGPAIAINSDGVLDYFGTTVNMAARVQNESIGGDVVLADSLISDAAIAAVLKRHASRDDAFTASLKGLSSRFTLHRLVPKTHA